MFEDDDTTTVYEVVMNHEEQYSIWPADRVLPAGWTLVGFRSIKSECLARINEIWADMRPLSLRKELDGQ